MRRPSWVKRQLSQSIRFSVSEFVALNDRAGIGYTLVWGFGVARRQRPAHRARYLFVLQVDLCQVSRVRVGRECETQTLHPDSST